MTALKKLYQLALLILIISFGIMLERVGLIEYFTVTEHWNEMLRLAGEHITLVAISMALATVTGLTVGIVFTRRSLRKVSGIIMYIVGLGQTIPSIAVLALVMGVLNIGAKTAIFALFIYSVLPIARNTLAGITSVPPSMIDAAKGMGMTPFRILVSVELPNSMRVILTGFRVALIINIGTAALAYLIGAGGLGELIFTGIDMMQTEKMLAGALPVTIMALFADFLCSLLRYALIPRGLRLKEA
ncbi:MAG: ABC transporter permease [Verrucomicrobiota bacterium]